MAHVECRIELITGLLTGRGEGSQRPIPDVPGADPSASLLLDPAQRFFGGGVDVGGRRRALQVLLQLAGPVEHREHVGLPDEERGTHRIAVEPQ